MSPSSPRPSAPADRLWLVPRAGLEVLLSEWSLDRAGWSDEHTHSETNIVLEGELHVECAGEIVIARTGDTVTVPAGHLGRYWAPVYARMFAHYGPNPVGRPHSDAGAYWHTDELGDPQSGHADDEGSGGSD